MARGFFRFHRKRRQSDSTSRHLQQTSALLALPDELLTVIIAIYCSHPVGNAIEDYRSPGSWDCRRRLVTLSQVCHRLHALVLPRIYFGGFKGTRGASRFFDLIGGCTQLAGLVRVLAIAWWDGEEEEEGGRKHAVPCRSLTTFPNIQMLEMGYTAVEALLKGRKLKFGHFENLRSCTLHSAPERMAMTEVSMRDLAPIWLATSLKVLILKRFRLLPSHESLLPNASSPLLHRLDLRRCVIVDNALQQMMQRRQTTTLILFETQLHPFVEHCASAMPFLDHLQFLQWNKSGERVHTPQPTRIDMTPFKHIQTLSVFAHDLANLHELTEVTEVSMQFPPSLITLSLHVITNRSSRECTVSLIGLIIDQCPRSLKTLCIMLIEQQIHLEQHPRGFGWSTTGGAGEYLDDHSDRIDFVSLRTKCEDLGLEFLLLNRSWDYDGHVMKLPLEDIHLTPGWSGWTPKPAGDICVGLGGFRHTAALYERNLTSEYVLHNVSLEGPPVAAHSQILTIIDR